ncbi:uncharacterized protein LOC132715481 [Ruditapes philippinarum]|uniref:uncharacterized protein LOC132715481 n=1 Tax=Ruditapes philippinarum TaxID=129788 RepID=UPI00295BD983|nr:uncharacterized protein LOC132715481 [Ruditapes philippinarum]
MNRYFGHFIKLLSFMLLQPLVNSKSPQKCVEPETLPNISFELTMNLTEAQSYSIIPGWFKGTKSIDIVPSDYINIKYKYHSGQTSGKKCKKSKNKNGRKNENTINSMSQCPWRYVENIDNNRKPRTILDAECICHTPLYSKKKSGLVCQSIIDYIVVFRRTGCTNGVYDYKLVFEPRAVACVATSLPEPQRLYKVAYKIVE